MYLKIVGIAGFAWLGAIITFILLLGSGLYYFVKFRAATLTSFWDLKEFHQHIIQIDVYLLGLFVLVVIIMIIVSIATLASKTRKSF